MWRLRRTTALSLWLLVAGIAGTGWLTAQSSQGSEHATAVGAVTHSPAVPRSLRMQARISVARTPPRLPVEKPLPAEAVARASPLQPLSTPSDTSQTWEKLRGHLDGYVVMQLQLDAGGGVLAASVRQSSGDEVLDEHALRSVRRWRFRVPPGQVGAISGELPMVFSSGQPLALTR